jgi:hypothetical protein
MPMPVGVEDRHGATPSPCVATRLLFNAETLPIAALSLPARRLQGHKSMK